MYASRMDFLLPEIELAKESMTCVYPYLCFKPVTSSLMKGKSMEQSAPVRYFSLTSPVTTFSLHSCTRCKRYPFSVKPSASSDLNPFENHSNLSWPQSGPGMMDVTALHPRTTTCPWSVKDLIQEWTFSNKFIINQK